MQNNMNEIESAKTNRKPQRRKETVSTGRILLREIVVVRQGHIL